MKKLAATILLVVLASAAFAAGSQETASGAQAQKIIKMRFGHYAAVDHPGNLAALQFAKAVNERTNGAIEVDVFPANQLGSPPEMLEQNILGAIDMSLPTQGALDKYSKKFAVVMLPFVFRDYAHVHRVLDGPFMEWAAPDLERQGLVFLSNWEYGFRNLTNNVRPVLTPADMRGLRIRTPPELQLQAAMESCGANVTTIAFNELILSLKQGVVDGQENPLAVIYHNKIYEVQKHLALTQHVYNSMVHVMSKKVWDQLTPAQRTIIREESVRASAFMRKAIQDEEKDLVTKLQAAGMQVTYPDTSVFKAQMQSAYARISDYAGKDNVDKFLEMVGK